MKLAFSGHARYTDYTPGYELYKQRTRSRKILSLSDYKRIIKRYCKILSDRLILEGVVDFPCNAGSIMAAEMIRKPQYRGNKFIGYGKKNWSTGNYDGNLKAFGIVYVPIHHKNENMRSFGFVANRELFKKMSVKYNEDYRSWEPVLFNDGMI